MSKTREELYNEMRALFAGQTGYTLNGDSDLSVRLQAAAAQLESLYAYEDYCLRQAFPQTAAGEYLDHHATMRGLSRTPGRCAEGELTFSLPLVHTLDVPLPAGTLAETAGGVRYATTEDAVIPAGQLSATVPAQALEPGPGALAGQVCYLPQPPAAVTAVTNAEAFSGGAAAEDDEALRARILSSYAVLPNGTNAAFYRQIAMSFSGVTSAAVLPRVNGTGTVGVVVATGTTAPDEDLLAEIEETMQREREIAVDVTVSAPTFVTVDLSLSITPAAGVQNAAEQIELLTRSYFESGILGRGLVLAQLGNVLYNTGLLENYRFLSPTTDFLIEADELAKLGTLTITEA